MRVLLVVAWVLLGIEVLYVVAANLFLNLNVLPLAFAGTDQVKVTIGGGWSLLPGRVHVKRVRVTYKDPNLQFSIDLARASLFIHLSELMHFTFHGSHVSADGVVFRVRNRIDPWAKSDPDVGAFPPIPEFPSPAVFEAYVPPAVASDAQAAKYWTIHLDDVDVATSEIWVQAFRYSGPGRARGKFELVPARRLWVGPASLDLGPGTVWAGAYRVASGVHGRIDTVVHSFDVIPPVGLEPLRFVTAHVLLDSPRFDPQVYTLFASEPSTQVSSASGSVHVDVAIDRGIFNERNQIDIVQRGLEVHTAKGDLNAEQVEVRASTPLAGSQASVIVDGAIIKEADAVSFAPRIDHLSATVVSSNRDSVHDFDFKEARLEEARLSLRDASWLNRWLKSWGLALSAGGASLLARGRYAEGALDADALLETDGIGASIGHGHLRYAGSVDAHLAHFEPARATGTLLAKVTGKALSAELGHGELRVAGLDAQVVAQRDAHGSDFHGEAKLSSLSTSGTSVTVHAPLLTLRADSSEGADGSRVTHFIADLPSLTAEGRGARLTTAAQARGTLAQPKNNSEQRFDVSATLLRPVAILDGAPTKKAETARVELRAKLVNDAAGALSGTLTLLPAPWRVDSGNMRFSGKSALALELSRLDLGRHQGNVLARLNSTGVTFGDTTQNADCPWSRVQSLQLDARAKLLADRDTALSVVGAFGQTELSWGDFTTRADIGLVANFDQGFFGRDGGAKLDVSLRNATLQSGSGSSSSSQKEGWAARIPALDLVTRLAQSEGKMTGSAHVVADGSHFRIGETRVNGDVKADFELDALDFDGHTAHSSGAVYVRNASLPDVPDPVSNWWADIKLDSLFGHAGDNLELGGTFRANLRDATPGLAVLAAQGSLPKWVASAFPLRDLSVTGSLARRCRLTDIHLVELAGGPAVARGRLQSVPKGFQGALLLRVAGFGAISAGLDFDAKHTHIGLFDGDAWLARWSQSFDRQSDAAIKLVCPPDPNRCTSAPTSEATQGSGVGRTAEPSQLSQADERP